MNRRSTFQLAVGPVFAGLGLYLLGQVSDIWQFVAVRRPGMIPADTLMGNMVVNVTIARWFIRMGGLAFAGATAWRKC